MNFFWWTDVKARRFIAQNASNVTQGSPGWLAAEEQLCSMFKRYVSQLAEDKFLQRIEYLKHAGDLGRTPMSIGIAVFFFLLVAAEAMGFSYMLGTWIARDGSANDYRLLMYGIVIVLASLLAVVTHVAGAQYYRTSLLRSCYRAYKESHGKAYWSRNVSLSDDQHIDANEASYTRCVNRVAKNHHDLGSYSGLWVAGVFVALIFAGSFAMRVNHMQAELNRETQAVEASSSNPFAARGLPSEVVAPQNEADKKARAEERSSTEAEGIAAILVLGVIFVVTQIVGFMAGYKHSFAGTETYKNANGRNSLWYWSQKDGAYADTGGFSTYDSYWEAMQPIKDHVNQRLKELQTRIKNEAFLNYNLTMTFDDYLSVQEARNREHRSEKATSVPRQASSAAPSPSTTSAIDQAKADIGAMTDRAAQQAYFARLSPDVQDALKPWLKQRKADAEARRQAQMEELF